MSPAIRVRPRRELQASRRRRSHRCWGHLIAAPLWPLHGANLGTLLRTCDAVGACLAVPPFPLERQATDDYYFYVLFSVSGQNRMVRPRNHLTLYRSMLSVWHFSYTQSAILDTEIKNKRAPVLSGANSFRKNILNATICY